MCDKTIQCQVNGSKLTVTIYFVKFLVTNVTEVLFRKVSTGDGIFLESQVSVVQGAMI